MMESSRLRKIGLGAVASFAAGCAGTSINVEKPGVSLDNVEVADIDMDRQTFVLDFDVVNPNPFPLPIRSVSYGIELDGFPGQREITWETSLSEGKNLLPLTLVAVTPTGGELLARLEHDNRNRTFRLQVEVG